MKNHKKILLFFIFISFFSIISNYYVQQSNIFQTGLITDFNTNSFGNENYMILKAQSNFYPNIGVTSMPIYAQFAKYHIIYQNYDEALKLLNRKNNVNPYLGFIESLKSDLYNRTGVRDSAYHYSKIAYEKIQNALHFQNYVRELALKKDLNKIKKVFKDLTDYKEIKDTQFWDIYFAGVIILMDEDDEEIKHFAQLAIEKFYTTKTTFVIASQILYGKENVDKAYLNATDGEDFFSQHRFYEAAQKFKEAFELFPLDYIFPENAGMALIYSEKYKEAIKYFQLSIDSKTNKTKTGKSEFGMGICYEKLGDIDKACKFFMISMSYNHFPAFRYYSNLCGK